MPTYEYRCKECGYRFEQMQKMSDDALITCPECKKDTLQRLVNAAAFHLKGSGWYKTDYASSGKSSEKSNSSSSGKEGSSDKGTESKSTEAKGTGSSESSKSEG